MNVYLCCCPDDRDPIVTSSKELAIRSFEASFRNTHSSITFVDYSDFVNVTGIPIGVDDEPVDLGAIKTLVVHDNFVCF